jgi:hypothetical protein
MRESMRPMKKVKASSKRHAQTAGFGALNGVEEAKGNGHEGDEADEGAASKKGKAATHSHPGAQTRSARATRPAASRYCAIRGCV